MFGVSDHHFNNLHSSSYLVQFVHSFQISETRYFWDFKVGWIAEKDVPEKNRRRRAPEGGKAKEGADEVGWKYRLRGTMKIFRLP